MSAATDASKQAGAIEVVMAFSDFISAFEDWLNQRSLDLLPIPKDALDEDSLPAFVISPRNLGA